MYRDVESTLSGQVRDFVHIVSKDNGVLFSSPKKISNDNWVISGCPHTGATMGADGQKIGMVWYTAGGAPGLYYTSCKFGENNFQPRYFLSEVARHPQLTSWNNQLAIVWEESAQIGTDHHGSKHHESKGTISLSVLDDMNTIKAKTLIDDSGGEFPVLIQVNPSELLVAYTRDHHLWVKRVNQ